MAKAEKTDKVKKKKVPKPGLDGKFGEDFVSNHHVLEYGDVVKSGIEVLNGLEGYETISVSPNLDLALGGGFREGTTVNITGDPKVGKTTTAFHFAAKAQKAGKTVIYCNTEGRLEKKSFTGIKGLDIEALKIVESCEDTRLSAEDYLNMIETYIQNTPNLVIIVDSLSTLVPQCELDGEIRTGIRNALPRLLALFFKRVSEDIQRTKAILLCITHNIADTGMSRRTKMADCGNMLQYQVSTNMIASHRKMWETSEGSKDYIGQICYWDIKTSSMGRPQSGVEGWIRYGIGVDETQEVMQVACELRLIKVAGSWYKIPFACQQVGHKVVKKILKDAEIDPEDEKAVAKHFQKQGAAKMKVFLDEHPELLNLIMSEIKSMSEI
jgi:recombination protein RecA